MEWKIIKNNSFSAYFSTGCPSNPAEPDKSLYTGIIYAGRVYNSATETNQYTFFLLPPSVSFLPVFHGRNPINGTYHG
jgi:hypothetical protein